MKKELERTNPVVTPTYIRYKGFFDVEELLQKAANWFSQRRYYWTEKEHTEKDKLEGQEMIIEWRAYRKIDDYLMFYINVVFFVLRYHPVIIEKKGKKIEMGQGQIEITIRADLEKDYNEQFKGKFLGEFFRILYEKFIIKRRIEKYEGKLLVECYDFHDGLKEMLGFLKKENRKFY